MPELKGAEASIVGGGVENNRMGAGDRGWRGAVVSQICGIIQNCFNHLIFWCKMKKLNSELWNGSARAG